MAKPPTKTPGKPGGGARRGLTTQVRAVAGRSVKSREWLQRQLNDPYVQAAQKAGWRSRAAFKLIQLDEKFHLLKPGLRVVDLGAAPGGWMQVAAARGCRVIGLDLLEIDPIPGTTILQGDFQEAAIEQAVLGAMAGPADLVLSDMAPNTTGHGPTDHLRIMGLAEIALDFAERVLVEGGAFAAKVFQGGSEAAMLVRLRARFAMVKHAKPAASRKDSSELYVVATGFKA